MSVKFEDYYKVLGVSKTASQQEIQKAYRKLAKKYHPDVSKEADAEEQFKRVSEAYEVLKDPTTRQQYDAFGGQYRAGQNVRTPPGWGGAGQNVNFEDLFGGQSAGFSDFFKVFMGGMGGGAGAGQSPFGGGGAGNPFQGAGNPFGNMGAGFGGGPQGRSANAYQQHATPKKNGKNRELDFEVPLEVLYRNGKHGLEVRRRGGDPKTYTITVPKGSTEGSQIRLAKQGDPGQGGGKPGDLMLTIRVVDRKDVEVDGFNLKMPVDIAPWEAISGTKVKVETFEGSVNLKIPGNLKPGAKLRIKHRGLCREDGTRGHLYVVPRIVIASELTEQEIELYQQLRELDEERRGVDSE